MYRPKPVRERSVNCLTNSLEFGYNDNNQLETITDQFGNVVRIERILGVPTAIISPDGWRTELTIDGYGQLTKLTYPDSNFFRFEYSNNDGLLTAKVEPNTNRFEHFFDDNGRVYKTTNQENGVWVFDSETVAEGKVTSSTTTPNTSSAVIRRTYSTGAVDQTSTLETGEALTTKISADELDSTLESSCGPKVETSEDLDTYFGHAYPARTTLTTPGGLTLNAAIDLSYVDSNADGLLESVTRNMTVNGKTAKLLHDITNSEYISTSPEGRMTFSTYDANTLQPLSSSVPGLLDSNYSYWPDGNSNLHSR